jgi:hypothetical protein
MAQILPFPVTRRHSFIARQADYAAEMRPAAAERYIQRQVTVQRESMARKGIREELIAHELRCFEAAIRALLQRPLMNTPSGAR